MARKTKTWAQKLADARAKADLGTVKPCEKTGILLALPSVADVEAEMREVPPGKVRTIKQMTDRFAERYKADMACPLVTGILVWIVANAAEEAGDDRIPWWRIVKTDGKLNVKFPCGPSKQRAFLEAEGVRVEDGKGKQPPRIRELAAYLR